MGILDRFEHEHEHEHEYEYEHEHEKKHEQCGAPKSPAVLS